MLSHQNANNLQQGILSLYTPLRVEEVEPKFNVKRAWMVFGTPGDCVNGTQSNLSEGEYPDIVISGPNHGPNLGTDILYSRTVSAALEGAMSGYQAMRSLLQAINKTLIIFIMRQNLSGSFAKHQANKYSSKKYFEYKHPERSCKRHYRC